MKYAPTAGWQYATRIASWSWTAWSTPGPLPWSAASCADHDGTGLGSVSVPVKPVRPGSGALWKPCARYQIFVVPWPGTGCAVPRNAVVSVDISAA